jgi:hypothetical protein
MIKRVLKRILLSRFVQDVIPKLNFMSVKTVIFVKFMNRLNAHLQGKGFSAFISVRPPESLHLVDRLILNPLNQDWGIVYHGKIINQKTLEFLVKNIISTRAVSPRIVIVVSVYDDEFYLQLKIAVQNLEVILIQCDDVGELKGNYPRSLCQQIETISSGLKYLEHAGVKKSVKVRVDQRINIETTIRLIDKLFLAFPSTGENALNRIWTTSYNSYLRRPLGASDMIMAGFTQDLNEYWSRISTSSWMEFTERLNQRYSNPIYAEFRIPETWLGARYLELKSIDLTSPAYANHIFWRDYMGVINSAHLSHSWMKTHEWLGSNFHTLNWFGNLLNYMHSEITFEDWVAIYSQS